MKVECEGVLITQVYYHDVMMLWRVFERTSLIPRFQIRPHRLKVRLLHLPFLVHDFDIKLARAVPNSDRRPVIL